MWSKGAVVIVKHGDKEIANAIVNSLSPPNKGDLNLKALECENYFLKRHKHEIIQRKIRRAERNYGYNWVPKNKYTKALAEFAALIEYGFAMFVDKFMTIKF